MYYGAITFQFPPYLLLMLPQCLMYDQLFTFNLQVMLLALSSAWLPLVLRKPKNSLVPVNGIGRARYPIQSGLPQCALVSCFFSTVENDTGDLASSAIREISGDFWSNKVLDKDISSFECHLTVGLVGIIVS